MGKASVYGLSLGSTSNPFDDSSYHSLIGEDAFFGTPQTFAGAVGREQGVVTSYVVGGEGLVLAGMKGAKVIGAARRGNSGPNTTRSSDSDLFDASGESDFYHTNPHGEVSRPNLDVAEPSPDTIRVTGRAGDDAVPLERVDFYVRPDGTAIPGTGYRYVSSESSYLESLNNSRTIPANSDGTYFSFDKYDYPVMASDRLQVPHDASIRLQFDTKQILDDVRVPYGNWGTANHLEPITADFTRFGKGGATQAITNRPIILDEIEDLRRNSGGE